MINKDSSVYLIALAKIKWINSKTHLDSKIIYNKYLKECMMYNNSICNSQD